MQIRIERLECGAAGSCGGDQFGTDGLTEIVVDGAFWGLVRWGAGMHFSIERGAQLWDLGRRKSRKTAQSAARRKVREILALESSEPEPH